MTIARICFTAVLLFGLLGCSEPDEKVTAAEDKRAFALSLEAEENWMRPGNKLPIRVRVESLTGPVQEELVEEVEFIANNGTVSPPSLIVVLAGPDSLGQGAESLYTGWVTFTSSSRATSVDQGEIHAIFRDALATLKIRIVPPVDDL